MKLVKPVFSINFLNVISTTVLRGTLWLPGNNLSMKHSRLSGLVKLSEAAQVTLVLAAAANVSTAVGTNMVLLE